MISSATNTRKNNHIYRTVLDHLWRYLFFAVLWGTFVLHLLKWDDTSWWICHLSAEYLQLLVHLVRSRGVAAFEQPIAAQSFGCFVIGMRSSKLGDTPITKQPAADAVGCSKAERTRYFALILEENNLWKSATWQFQKCGFKPVFYKSCL